MSFTSYASDVRPEQIQTDFVSEAMALDGPGAMARVTDPFTSHHAADTISKDAREASERFVLDVLADRGPLTDEMILHVATMNAEPWSPSRIRTARKQLVDKGLVEDSGIKARTDSGRLAIEWVLS